MPIHVQTPEGKVLTWVEQQEIILRREMELAPERHFLNTHDAIMKHFSRKPIDYQHPSITFGANEDAKRTWEAMAAIPDDWLPKFSYIDNSKWIDQANEPLKSEEEPEEDIYDAVLSLRKEKGVYPFKICTNEWDQDENNPGKFWGTGWYDEETDSFMDFIEWEMDEILDTDKFGNPIKARFIHKPNK